MKVLTESGLRMEFKNKFPQRYVVSPKTMVTPSAKEFLKQKKIELIYETETETETETTQQATSLWSTKEQPKEKRYKDYYHGGYFQEKPEHLTQLYGNVLVRKDDFRIQLRGKLDSFQAQVLEVQIFLEKEKEKKLLEELTEVLDFARNILRAEVLEEPFEQWEIAGMDQAFLRKASHHPQKYLQVEHILPDYSMGPVLIKLNTLRSLARELEIIGIQAFATKEGKIQRQDLLQALNRLSSGIYVMMCRWRGNYYQKRG